MDILLNKTIKTDKSIILTPAKELKKGDIIPIVSDTMFKIMLGNESKKKFTAYFLSLILNRDKDLIEENMEFIKNDLDQDKFIEAKRSVDVIIKLDGKLYNIEMNNNKNILSLERNIDYATKLYSSSRKRGTKYNYDYVFQININNFYFEGEEETIGEYELININDSTKSLTDKLHFMYFYLPKMLEKYYNKDKLTELEKLLLVLNSKEVGEFSDIKEENSIMEDIEKDAYNASSDDEIIGLYDKEEEDEWMRKALAYQAAEKTRKENAINFMKIGTSLTDISKALEIDIKELEKIREENNIPNYDEITGVYDKEEEDEWMRKASAYQAAEKTRKENAINLIKNGVSLDLISKSLNISIEELERINKEN